MALTKVTYSMIEGSSVNVLDYGADDTGVADSTAAIQAAIDSSATDIYFPDGVYKITTKLTLKNFVRLTGNFGFSNTNDTVDNGGVKLVFTGTETACFDSPSATVQIKYVTIAGLTIVASGTYDWIFKYTAPLECRFDNVNALNTNAAGGVFYGTYVSGQISWINHFVDCQFGSSDSGTQYNMHYYCSDSFINGCYFSGGKGVLDQSYGGNLYVNTHFDRTTVAGAGLIFLKHPETVGQDSNTTNVVGCYFDENYVGIQLNATTSTVGGKFFNTTISGCTFRNKASGGVADISWNASGSFTTLGSAVVGCAMSGVLPSFAFLNANWQNITFAGNTNVDATNIQYSGIDTPGIIKSTNSSYTFRSATNVSGIFGANGGYALLGSLTGTVPFVGASLNGSGLPTSLKFVTNNAAQITLNEDGTFFYPENDNTTNLGGAANRWANVYAIAYYAGASNLAGASGSFTTADSKTVTVTGGIITSIV